MASKRLILRSVNTKMNQVLGFGGLTFGLCLMSAMVWLQNRPKKELKVSLVPHTPLMFVGAFIAIVSVAYLLHVYGVHLPPRPGRF